jgi:hypothetical protein
MHTYSTDNDLRPRILLCLGAVSYALVLAIGAVLTFVNTLLPFGWALSAPAVGGVLTVTYLLFASKLWNHDWLRRLGIVKTPYFGGRWQGYIQSSYNVSDEPENGKLDASDKMDVEVEIEQSWRKIIVRLEGDDSSSRSLGASIITQQGKPRLAYYYLNEPDYGAPDSYRKGYGTTLVELCEGENGEDVLDGIYYTGPERSEHGKIRLTRVNCE